LLDRPETGSRWALCNGINGEVWISW
jgi:hypothetical protein